MPCHALPAASAKPAAPNRSGGGPSRPNGRRRSKARTPPPYVLKHGRLLESVRQQSCTYWGSSAAAPPSDCISQTSGTVPQILGAPAADQASDNSPIPDEGVMG